MSEKFPKTADALWAEAWITIIESLPPFPGEDAAVAAIMAGETA